MMRDALLSSWIVTALSTFYALCFASWFTGGGWGFVTARRR